MFSPDSAASSSFPALPAPIIYRSGGRNWLCQPGVTPTTLLSLHTRQGLRVRMVASDFIDLTGLPADEYLLRIQLPEGEVYVRSVQVD
ncbi:hypothetical protein GO988_19835 [Hymenobacter sp. HMF4947]|uniref:Uncharacterized protein n=1 Tax=Hymenobacter ginkgonis TaxID=2682976 RepID=A0A7K1TJL5_9BACT|nr:hypothetical protein [Hymenobacter ginkgonis]MVN78589.1 hypothetical protein [Hymenobacter ginkgonis]